MPDDKTLAQSQELLRALPHLFAGLKAKYGHLANVEPLDGVLFGSGFSVLCSLSNTRKIPHAPLSSANVRVL